MSESRSVMSDSLWLHGLYSSWNSPGQNTGVGSRSFLQRIFPTQGLNPGLPHWKRIFYQLSHEGSPRILEWVVYPFSRPRIEQGSLALQADSLPTELSGRPACTVNMKVNGLVFRKYREEFKDKEVWCLQLQPEKNDNMQF